MTTLQYATQVPSDGYVVLPPEFRGRNVVVSTDSRTDINVGQPLDGDWPKATGEQLEKRQQRIAAEKARIMSRTPEEREEAFDALQKLMGSLKDTPGAKLISKKQIRSARLEEKYGEQTEEQRKAAGQKFFDTWDGLLEGMPDMTAKEIRAERLERKYGQ